MVIADVKLRMLHYIGLMQVKVIPLTNPFLRLVSTTMHILIVEDYQRLQRLYEKILSLAGHEIYKATTLDEARTILKTQHIDICLLDVHLGFRSSIDLIKTLPEHENDPTRYIVVSGWDQYREVCKAANIDFYLKPISNKDLIKLVSGDNPSVAQS